MCALMTSSGGRSLCTVCTYTSVKALRRRHRDVGEARNALLCTGVMPSGKPYLGTGPHTRHKRDPSPRCFCPAEHPVFLFFRTLWALSERRTRYDYVFIFFLFFSFSEVQARPSLQVYIHQLRYTVATVHCRLPDGLEVTDGTEGTGRYGR